MTHMTWMNVADLTLSNGESNTHTENRNTVSSIRRTMRLKGSAGHGRMEHRPKEPPGAVVRRAAVRGAAGGGACRCLLEMSYVLCYLYVRPDC